VVVFSLYLAQNAGEYVFCCNKKTATFLPRLFIVQRSNAYPHSGSTAHHLLFHLFLLNPQFIIIRFAALRSCNNLGAD
jgi:hypothetical protein